MRSLQSMNYTTPTPIQAQTIQLALNGQDVLGSAQTGTGKTGAFSIPLVEAILNSEERNALILTPTRELAKQVMDVIHELLGHKSNVKTAFIIGGAPMHQQTRQLRNRPRIIVGTPGRINDHLDRGEMDLGLTSFLVLDETDRMLDMGFGVQLDQIIKHLPAERQTLMFSATLPKAIIAMSSKYLHKPERVSIGETNVVAQNIQTEIVRIDQDKKYHELMTQLHDREGSVIVFIKTKHGADRMARNLRRDGFTSDALHGDLRQNKRDKVMRNFRDKNFRILVATDIAARGLDVPHIQHVVNYDLPQVAEDYIHRMGRTARAGASGSALCFISPQDGRKWHAIEMLLDPDKAANDRGGKNNEKRSNHKKRKPRRHNHQSGNPSENKSGNKAGGKPSNGPFKGNGKGQDGQKRKGNSSSAKPHHHAGPKKAGPNKKRSRPNRNHKKAA